MFQVFPFQVSARGQYIEPVCIRIFFNGSAKITAGNTGDKNCEVCRFTRIGGFANSSASLGRPPRPYKSVIGQKISEKFGIYRGGYRCIRKLYTPLLHSSVSPGTRQLAHFIADASKFRRKCAKQIEDGSNFAKWKKEQVTFSFTLSKILLARFKQPLIFVEI